MGWVLSHPPSGSFSVKMGEALGEKPMPTNNDQVIKKRKRKLQRKTVDEFTPEDWERFKPGLAVKEFRKDMRQIAEATKKQAAMEGKHTWTILNLF